MTNKLSALPALSLALAGALAVAEASPAHAQAPSKSQMATVDIVIGAGTRAAQTISLSLVVPDTPRPARVESKSGGVVHVVKISPHPGKRGAKPSGARTYDIEIDRRSGPSKKQRPTHEFEIRVTARIPTGTRTRLGGASTAGGARAEAFITIQ